MTKVPKQIWAFPYTMRNLEEEDGYWSIHERKECKSVPYIQAEIAAEMLAALKHAVAEWDYPAHALDKHAILAMRYAVTKAEETGK